MAAYENFMIAVCMLISNNERECVYVCVCEDKRRLLQCTGCYVCLAKKTIWREAGSYRLMTDCLQSAEKVLFMVLGRAAALATQGESMNNPREPIG
jgi:hypothetical protein